MAKFYGRIGFVRTVETEPGVYEERAEERFYYGNLVSFNFRSQSGEYLNDNVNISNRISILADSFANENCQAIRYVDFMGAKWKVTNIEIQYPCLILSVGGEYNGQQASTAECPGRYPGI